MESPDVVRVEMAARLPGQDAPRVTSTLYKRMASTPLTSTPAAKAPNAPKAMKAKISQVAWISGTWSGTSSSGTTFEERWTPTAAGSMMAISRTIRADGLMSAFEFLCIVERDGGLVGSSGHAGVLSASVVTLQVPRVPAANAPAGRSGVAGVGGRGAGGEDLAGLRSGGQAPDVVLEAVLHPPVRREHEQGSSVLAAERAREPGPVERDRVQQLAALGDPQARRAGL